MFGFIRKIFGGKSDFQQFMEDRTRGPMSIGKDMAQDCIHNGIRKGEFVLLSEMTQLIQENHSYMPAYIEDGFIKEMMVFVKSGEIINLDVGDGEDVVFILREGAHDFLKKIREEEGSS